MAKGSYKTAANCRPKSGIEIRSEEGGGTRSVDKTVESLSINGDNNSQNAETEAFPDVDNFAVPAGRL